MKKICIYTLTLLLSACIAQAATTAFDSMDKAVEVKANPTLKSKTTQVQTPTSTTQVQSNTIQLQKYTNALVNLDDAQVELRQDLATATNKYNNALVEKQKAIQNCKNLKKEIKEINKKMINANLET